MVAHDERVKMPGVLNAASAAAFGLAVAGLFLEWVPEGLFTDSMALVPLLIGTAREGLEGFEILWTIFAVPAVAVTVGLLASAVRARWAAVARMLLGGIAGSVLTLLVIMGGRPSSGFFVTFLFSWAASGVNLAALLLTSESSHASVGRISEAR